MQFDYEADGIDRIVTFDIETASVEPGDGTLVSIGVGSHEVGAPGVDAEYELLHRQAWEDEDESTLIDRAFEAIDDADADALVSHNGIEFDFDYVEGRAGLLDHQFTPPALHTQDQHYDTFLARKRATNNWVSLEDCLSSYGYPEPKTVWNGRPLTNTRFGEELGPAYMEALRSGDYDRAADLRDIIEHYLITDLEGNVALFHGDANVDFEPHHMVESASFEV